jgi:ribosomal protein S18 acetylase RimI-like enzyme
MSTENKQGLNERKGLNAAEIEEIGRLAQECNQYEKLDLKLNWGTLQKRPTDQLNDFLYYADGQLVGFLCLFNFNSEESEVSGMVHPDYRQRGICKMLYEAVLQESQKRGTPSLLFIVEQASLAGQACVRQLPTTYDHSEYKMVRQESSPLPATSSDNEHLQIRAARPADLPSMSRITAQAFNIPGDDVDWYTEQSLEQNDRRHYVGEIDGTVIGKIDTILFQDTGVIIGFAVRPEDQGKGYGHQILAYTIQEILTSGRQHIWLEVATENKQALKLYQSYGFTETGSYDYYRQVLKDSGQNTERF